MPLLQGLIYVSKATVNFNLSDLRMLSEISAINNAKHNITGYLYFENRYFMQYLEGAMEDVELTIDIIKLDRRHKILQQIPIADLTKRHFPDWSMQYLSESAVKKVKIEEILNDYITALSAEDQQQKSNPSGMKNIRLLLDTLSDYQMELQYL